ncbi:MAG TPA: toprim domain-containing protein, partial [Alphaproteobacteria bacterium]|nr:toprim domain-containing protein [Alphaproteobacteria bacterium]
MLEPEIIQLFKECGVDTPPTEITYDKYVRIKADSEDSKRSVSYKIRKQETSSATIYHVSIRNFKTGNFVNKLVIPEDVPKSEADEAREIFEKQEEADSAETFIRNETAAIEAERQWALAAMGPPLPSYLKEKRISEMHGMRSNRDTLVIPMRDMEGKLWSIQTIYKQGDGFRKNFLPGSTYNGCFFQFGEVTEKTEAIFFAEGIATAASLYELQGRPTVCCFSSQNLKNVTKQFRSYYVNLDLVVAADVDPVGIKYGEQAARAVSGKLLPPPIVSRHPNYKDWNDYIIENGKDLSLMKVLDFKDKEKELTKQEWIKEWLEKNRVEVKYSNRITIFGHEQTSFDDLYDRLYCDQETEFRKISQPLLRSRLNLYIKERWKEEFERLKAPLFKENPIPKEINDPVTQFLKALTGEKNPAHYAAISHFIWQVKRKIKGLPIENHMMLILHGATQGKGKSVAMKKLIGVLGDLAKPGDLSLCTDKRDWDALERYYIIYMDEMAKID